MGPRQFHKRLYFDLAWMSLLMLISLRVRIHFDPSTSLRGWSGAGVGVGMLRGREIPLLENKKFQSVLVSWFLVFFLFCLVYWFLGLLVSWFIGLLVYWFVDCSCATHE